MKTFRSFTSFILFLGGYVSLLILIPTRFPPAATLPNLAAQAGYNTRLASITIIAWSLAGLVFFALTAKPGTIAIRAAEKPGDRPPFCLTGRPWLECLLAGAVAMALYWPPFLARYGTFIEDKLFINILNRMQCGQLPYRDFEFLYSPLMAYPAHFWMNLLGFSLRNYYWLLAILQGLVFFVVMRLFQKHVGNPWARYAAFMLFAAFLFDSLLGLNYIGWRILLVLLAIAAVSANPSSRSRGMGAGCLIGLQAAYSYEYGVVAFLALLMLYGIIAIKERQPGTAAAGAVFAVTSLVVAILVSWGLTGATFGDFLGSARLVMGNAQLSGIGNFPFYWTVNSLALFGLLSIAVITVGSGLLSQPETGLSYGDRLLLGALLFALGSLPLAMQRADVWHITLPFVPMLAILLWDSPRRVFIIDQNTRRLALALIVIASLTRLVGLLPSGSYFLDGLVRGGKDSYSRLFGGTGPETHPLDPASYGILAELSHPPAKLVSLREYLSGSERKQRPVIFYNRLWAVAAFAGACPAGYSYYPLVYANQYDPITRWLDKNRNALVIMSEPDYRQLFESDFAQSEPRTLTATKRLASWTSSIHFTQKAPEAAIKFEAWKRILGDYLVSNYHESGRIGDMVILENRDDAAGRPR